MTIDDKDSERHRAKMAKRKAVQDKEVAEKTIEKGTKPDTRITIETPIIHLSKADIVQKGINLNAPLHLSWSCYRSEDAACGTCDSCALRLRGFERAGVTDPITYQSENKAEA